MPPCAADADFTQTHASGCARATPRNFEPQASTPLVHTGTVGPTYDVPVPTQWRFRIPVGFPRINGLADNHTGLYNAALASSTLPASIPARMRLGAAASAGAASELFHRSLSRRYQLSWPSRALAE
eukprot:GHVU01169596.1.p2 GENE.GHVU01169596.1~~GHVU01169596.1.p2  ORF type:complete len:126 (-),score=4.26 GHVU01169596.1:149-526(-)